MNKVELKRLFTPFIYQEIFGEISKKLVEETAKQLEKAGFSGQAHARDINFFYLTDQVRERIVWNGSIFKVMNTHFTFDNTLSINVKNEIGNVATSIGLFLLGNTICKI